MSQVTISKCCEEILVDPSLLWPVSGGGMEVHPQASISGCYPIPDCIGEAFAHLVSPSLWGKARVEFITSKGQKANGEIAPKVALVTDGMEEGSLDMVATFCHHDQAKEEPSEVLPILVQ